MDPEGGSNVSTHPIKKENYMKIMTLNTHSWLEEEPQEKLKQIESVKDALFPNDSLQERTDNFLNFYQTDPRFIDKLVQLFDPFDFQFNVVAL